MNRATLIDELSRFVCDPRGGETVTLTLDRDGAWETLGALAAAERDALAAKVERVRALPAKHPAGGWYVTSMRDVLAALDEEPQPDLPDWVHTKTEAVRTAQLQQHERALKTQQLQQVGTIQKIIERGYDEGV